MSVGTLQLCPDRTSTEWHIAEAKVNDQAIIKISDPDSHGFWKLPILWEEEGLLALDKPSHLLLSPDKHRADDPVLTKLLQRDLASSATWTKSHDLDFIDLIHPLDFEASGVALYGTNKETFTSIRNLCGSRLVTYEFVALAHGVFEETESNIELKLAPHPTRRWLMRVNRTKGKPSSTQLQVIEQFRDYAYVKGTTTTLRTHQIRVQLQHVGHAVVGDALYGGDLVFLSQLKRKYRGKRSAPEKPLIDRTAVHLSRVSLKHPDSGNEVEIESPLPKDLKVALRFLRQFNR